MGRDRRYLDMGGFTEDDKLINNLHDEIGRLKKENKELKKQLSLYVVSKFYKCWNCKNFFIEQIESKENYAKYFCKKHKENCNITDPKWQTCDDFEPDCNFC